MGILKAHRWAFDSSELTNHTLESAQNTCKFYVNVTKHSYQRAVVLPNEPRCEKTGLQGFRPGPTQTELYCNRRWLEACNFVCRKKKDCTIRLAKTMALISFAYAKSRFSHNEAQI